MAARMANTKAHSGGKKPRKFDRKKKGFRQGPRLKKWQMDVEEVKKLQLRYEGVSSQKMSKICLIHPTIDDVGWLSNSTTATLSCTT